MQGQSDNELLHAYATAKSEAAFSEIVRRYSDLVYSAAMRQSVDADQARDLAQTVFADLARKAGSLPPGTLLIGWLYRSARFAALDHIRKEQRRHQRERDAMQLSDPPAGSSANWHAIRPVLDSAMATLDVPDRDAVLLRFFKGESLAAVGAALGVSEDAAQKRVARAVGRVREFFAKRGIRTTDEALSVALAAHAVEAGPNGLAATLTASALAQIAAPALPASVSAFSAKSIILTLALGGGFATLVLLNLHSFAQLRQARDLVRQQAADLATLRAAPQAPVAAPGNPSTSRNDEREILRLRGEIALLRRELADREAAHSLAATVPLLQDSTPARPTISIKTHFLAIPARFAAGDMTGILTAEQATAAIDAFKRQGAVVLGEPMLITVSGRRGKVMIGSTVPLAGVHTNIGLTVDLMPECPTNSAAGQERTIDLSMAARLTRLMDASPAQDGSQPQVEAMDITNSAALNVLSGNTMVLVRRTPGDWPWMNGNDTNAPPTPRNLMIFVSPEIVGAAETNGLQTADAPSSTDITALVPEAVR